MLAALAVGHAGTSRCQIVEEAGDLETRNFCLADHDSGNRNGDFDESIITFYIRQAKISTSTLRGLQ